MISTILASAVERAAGQLVAQSGHLWPGELTIGLEHPHQASHGDFSANAAMLLARTIRRSPMSIALDIRDRLLEEEEISIWLSKVEAAPPGFLNFYLNWQKWAEYTANEPALPKSSGGKIVIEHTSINPNKSAHIGHLRNSCIGDTLARMLAREGRQVEVHNYIDDLGNQLADTIVGLIHTPASSESYGRFGDYCWDTYAEVNRAYKDNPALQQQRAAVLHELEQGTSNLAWAGLLVAERIVREHVEEMRQFGIGYDVLVWESSIVREGFWEQAFELLQRTTLFHLETEGKLTGCWVLKQPGEDIGASGEHDYHADKVLVRSNGILTYTAKDIAYHLWKFGLLGKDFKYKKFEPGLWTTSSAGSTRKIGRADTVINVIDHRQQYPQEMVKQALVALGYGVQAERLKHVSYGVVSLSPDTAQSLGVVTSDGKQSYPMSGRQGIGIRVTDFLDRMERTIEAKRSRRTGLSSRTIAAAAMRYYLLKFHLQTEVVFDLEQATEISGNTGVYLLYSYARSRSILNKAGVDSGADAAPVIRTLEEQELQLIRHLAYWPDTLQKAVRELAPNLICTYAYELSTLFNHFYATCPVLKVDPPKREVRLWLTKRFRDVLQDALDILGMPAPKRM